MPEKDFTLREVKSLRKRNFELCGQNFWHFAKYLTTDDEERAIRRPFPLDFKYLIDIEQDVKESRRLVILKPRRMLISLLMIAMQLHNAKFAGCGIEGVYEVYRGGYSATDEILALYQLFRIQQMHDRLPMWMQEMNPMVKKNTLHKEFQNGGKIEGYPLKRQGPQGHGFTDFIFDEAAWQEAAAMTYKGLAPTIGKGKIIIVSTPNGDEGTGLLFHHIWTGYGGRYKKYRRVEIDWWDNPEHDQEWFEDQSSDLQPWEVAQMYEKSFIVIEGDPVFPKFVRSYHVADKKPPAFVEGIPIYIGWDFGYDYPAAIISQRSARDQWVILREFCGDHIEFNIFCKLVLDQANSLYDRKKCREIHCIDPEGLLNRYRQRAKSGATCDAHEIKIQWNRESIDGTKAQVRPGAVTVGTRSSDGPRIKEVQRLFQMRGDDRYGIIIHPDCDMIIKGLGGGYVRDKQGKPIKNRYSHTQDCIQYIVTAYKMMGDPSIYKKSAKSKDRVPLSRRVRGAGL